MSGYRLSKDAAQDYANITEYGDKNFGTVQSNRYLDQLEQRFLALAESPYRYHAVDDIRPGYRRSVCGAHSIYYRIEAGGGVEVMRILGR